MDCLQAKQKLFIVVLTSYIYFTWWGPWLLRPFASVHQRAGSPSHQHWFHIRWASRQQSCEYWPTSMV